MLGSSQVGSLHIRTTMKDVDFLKHESVLRINCRQKNPKCVSLLKTVQNVVMVNLKQKSCFYYITASLTLSLLSTYTKIGHNRNNNVYSLKLKHSVIQKYLNIFFYSPLWKVIFLDQTLRWLRRITCSYKSCIKHYISQLNIRA